MNEKMEDAVHALFTAMKNDPNFLATNYAKIVAQEMTDAEGNDCGDWEVVVRRTRVP